MGLERVRVDFETTLYFLLIDDKGLFKKGFRRREISMQDSEMTEFIPEGSVSLTDKLTDWDFVDRQEVYDSISKRVPSAFAEELIHELDTAYSVRAFGSVFPRFKSLERVFNGISSYARANDYQIENQI